MTTAGQTHAGRTARRAAAAQIVCRRRKRSVDLVRACAAVFCGLALADAANAEPLAAQDSTPNFDELPAISDTTNPAAAMDSVLQSPLFGDLPFRLALQAKGIDFIVHYTGETMSNTAGFKGVGTDYAQQVDFGIAFDLDKLGIWRGAVARFAMTDRAGRSTSDDYTGSYFVYQEAFGQGENLRFNEITVEVHLSQMVAIKFGFSPMGSDFATLPYVCNFVNTAFCGHPQSLPTNSGWSDAPAGRWGARLKWRPTDKLTFQTGVYDVNPLVVRKQDGFKLDFSGSTGVIVPVELAYQLGNKPSDYAGTYKIGAYYDSSAAVNLATGRQTDAGRYGFYLEAAQQIYKTGPDHREGLAIFGVYTLSDPSTAKFKDYFEAGVGYRGLLPGRELDILCLGWVRTDINPKYQLPLPAEGKSVQTYEQLVELSYTTQLAPWLTFRPDIQYDMQPGAIQSRPSTWVFGAQIKATL